MERLQKAETRVQISEGCSNEGEKCFMCKKTKSLVMYQNHPKQVVLCRECLKLGLGVIKRSHEKLKKTFKETYLYTQRVRSRLKDF